ncbi:MAG TPA: hydantoinase B/oxoprolinase family protein [Steroidobacteraceae bacterium]|nr:hydantoinase B/oxoprolinase family protein [Steroidobacteraceae bacterium]
MTTKTGELFHFCVSSSAGPVRGSDADPIVTEIVRNSLNSIAAQIMRAFVRTAFTQVIYEMNDFAIALYDPQVRLLAQANSLPVFVGTLNFCVDAAVSAVGGPEALAPGDVVIYNMPYGTGSHAQDVAIVVPSFQGSQLVGYICSKAHWMDVGAKDPYCTDTTDVFQEGVVLPGIKLYSRGTLNADVFRIILANSRAPRACEGDLKAQVTSAQLGARQLARLMERYGSDTFRRAVERMFDHGEAQMRQFLEAIPDGRYVGTGRMDDNGLDNVPIAFEIDVEVRGSRVVIDFSRAPDAQLGPTNCPMPSTVSGSRVAITMLAASNVQPNEGHFRPIEVVTRPGSMFHPLPPQPCFLYGWPLMAAMEAINEAVSQAATGLAPAGGVADNVGLMVYGRGGDHDELWTGGSVMPVGYGAHLGGDGATLFVPALAFSTMVPMEIDETKSPLVYEAMEFVPDSCGAGRWRGGMGWRRQFRVVEDCQAISTIEGTKAPPCGQRGGLSGAPSRLIIVRPSGERRQSGKGTAIKLPKGTRVMIDAGGGGGYGKPLERDPVAVRRDMREGYITEEYARTHYPQAFVPRES